MTEKRFTYLDASKSHYIGSFFCNGVPLTNKEFVELLNELHEENIELHIQNDFLKDENQHMRDLVNENEQLKQFQDRVFSWIDMHLQRLPTLRDDEFESDNEFADPSLYSGAIQILETMKRELKGDVE